MMRFWHLLVIVTIIILVALLLEGHNLAKKEAICSAHAGTVLKSMDGNWWCVIDGKLVPISKLQ